MIHNDGLIITLAYPETIVSHSGEWYSKFLRYFSVGNKKYVRAGHAALVLVNKSTGVLEYYDFGRYITSGVNGRVRGSFTDFELKIPLKAEINNGVVSNIDTILKFFATHPKVTHGEGTLYASICNKVNYDLAKTYVEQEQSKGFIRYAAFAKNASNCARFVVDALVTSVTDLKLKKKLIKCNGFTSSPIGNVVAADTENYIYKLTDKGEFETFNTSIFKLHISLFLDRLKGYDPGIVGSILPQENGEKQSHAQWLSGIAAGAWFEISSTSDTELFRFRRISPHGNVDCDAFYSVNDSGFDIYKTYEFLHNSNCLFFHIEQDQIQYRFDFAKNYEVINLVQRVHSA